MSLQRTPPKFASDSNIPASSLVENETKLTRKRKQPENDYEQRIKCIEERLDKQTSTLDEKITECIINSVTAAVNAALSTELTKISATLTTINTNVTKLTSDCDNLNKSLSEMEKALRFTMARQDDFELRVKKIEDTLPEASASIKQIQLLEYKIQSLEQQARHCNIEISNIPDRRGENLISIIENLGNAIKHPILSSDIVAVHRVPHADHKDRRPKNIIVKFTSRMLRDNVIAASRAIKGLDSSKLSISGPASNIYINEHLTLCNKLLFRQCRETAKKHEYKYVWVKHGTILARKSDNTPAIAIRSHHDVAKIK